MQVALQPPEGAEGVLSTELYAPPEDRLAEWVSSFSANRSEILEFKSRCGGYRLVASSWNIFQLVAVELFLCLQRFSPNTQVSYHIPIMMIEDSKLP